MVGGKVVMILASGRRWGDNVVNKGKDGEVTWPLKIVKSISAFWISMKCFILGSHEA